MRWQRTLNECCTHTNGAIQVISLKFVDRTMFGLFFLSLSFSRHFFHVRSKHESWKEKQNGKQEKNRKESNRKFCWLSICCYVSTFCRVVFCSIDSIISASFSFRLVCAASMQKQMQCQPHSNFPIEQFSNIYLPQTFISHYFDLHSTKMAIRTHRKLSQVYAHNKRVCKSAFVWPAVVGRSSIYFWWFFLIFFSVSANCDLFCSDFLNQVWPCAGHVRLTATMRMTMVLCVCAIAFAQTHWTCMQSTGVFCLMARSSRWRTESMINDPLSFLLFLYFLLHIAHVNSFMCQTVEYVLSISPVDFQFPFHVQNFRISFRLSTQNQFRFWSMSFRFVLLLFSFFLSSVILCNSNKRKLHGNFSHRNDPIKIV